MGADLWRRLDFIRRMGNNASHSNRKITEEQAILCLENLHIFLDFVAYCYGTEYEETHFNRDLIGERSEEPVAEEPDLELSALMAENEALRAELTARREAQQQSYVPKPLDISEYKTRKLYIDSMLIDAGWVEGKDWVNEYELPGMPNKSEVGYADYVLYDDAVSYVLGQRYAIFVVLLSGEDFIGLAVQEADKCHPFLFVVLETYHIGFKDGGAYLGDCRFEFVGFLLFFAVGRNKHACA